jgi:hypothetical protein
VGVTGIELVVGYLAAWGVRKLRRTAARADAEADRVERSLFGGHRD